MFASVGLYMNSITPSIWELGTLQTAILIPKSQANKTAAHWVLFAASTNLFSDHQHRVWIFSACFLHWDGNSHTIRAVSKSHKNRHGDGENSIRIFSVCSPPTLAHRGSAKDVWNSQKGKPRQQETTARVGLDDAQSYRGAVLRAA